MELKAIFQSNFPEAELLCQEDRITLIRLRKTSTSLSPLRLSFYSPNCLEGESSTGSMCTHIRGCGECRQGHRSSPWSYHLVITFCYLFLLPCTQADKVKSYTQTTLRFVNVITKVISSAMEFFIILHILMATKVLFDYNIPINRSLHNMSIFIIGSQKSMTDSKDISILRSFFLIDKRNESLHVSSPWGQRLYL